MKILIVDDNSNNLYMLEALLKGSGYEIVTEKDGIEALESLRTSRFDGIISDILMPRMDGFQLIRECKKDPVLRQIPFIFYTATYTDKKDEAFGLSLGAIRYIIKPAEPETLLMEIHKAIQEHVQSPRDYMAQPVPDEYTFSREYTHRVGAKLDKKTRLLEESEEKYHLLYDNSMDAILITSPDGSIIAANPAACAMFQQTEKEIIRNGRAGVVDSTDPRLRTALEERGFTGRFKGELTFLRKDGTPFPGEIFSNSFKDSRGSTLTSMIIRDISERKKAEDELRAAYEQIAASSEELRAQYDMLADSERSVRESEEKYRTILDTTSEWIWDMDLDGRHTYSNPALESLLGYTLDEFMGFKTFDLIHPKDRKRIEKIFSVSVKERKGWRNVIIRWRHKDRNYRFLESNATTIFNERGELTGFRGADHDITERKLAEEALRESEEKFKTLFESAGDAILIRDRNVFLDCNKKTEHIFGWRRDQIIGKSLAIFSPEHQPDGQLSARITQEKIDAAFLGETQFFEYVYIRADGTPFHAGVTLNRFMVGDTFYLQEIVRDITEHKRSQKALEQAKKKLNLLNYVTFNDIQNMVFTLSGYNYLVKDKITESSVKLIIQKEDDILQKITHSLKFSQSYQDLGIRMPRWYNVNQVFLLAISHLDFLSMKHTVTLDGLEIFADPLLEQVFQILADNTLTHGKSATEVTLRYAEGSESLTVFFEDNGVGIVEDIKDKIFSPDFQKNKTVGLFLVREILEITRITITETGEPGKGARFEITVPKGQYRFTSQ